MTNVSCRAVLREQTRFWSRGFGFIICATMMIGFAIAIASGGAAAQTIIAKISVPYGGDLTVDPVLNHIYLGNGNPAAQPVIVIDGYTFTTTQPGPVGQTIGVNRVNNNYWAPGVYSGAIPVYDGNSNALITTESTGFCPQHAEYDIRYNRVWVGAQCGSGNDPVFAFNATTYAPEAGPVGTGGVLGGTVINSATGILYVSSNGIKRVDPVTFAVTATSLPNTVQVADPVRNLLYGFYASGGNNFLYIASGGSRTKSETIQHTITLPFAPAAMGVNTALAHIYLANSSTQSIDVRNSISGADITSFSLGVLSVGGITVDSIRGRVYVNVNTMSGSSVYVIEDLSPAIKVSDGY